MNILPMIDIRTLMEEVTDRMVAFNHSGVKEDSQDYVAGLEKVVESLVPLCKGLEDHIALAGIFSEEIAKQHSSDLSFYKEMLTKIEIEIITVKSNSSAA